MFYGEYFQTVDKFLNCLKNHIDYYNNRRKIFIHSKISFEQGEYYQGFVINSNRNSQNDEWNTKQK